VRAPRAGGRDRAPEPYGLDAREFLRKKLIGKEVRGVVGEALTVIGLRGCRVCLTAVGVWRTQLLGCALLS
jgi:hypothetical protein